MIQEPNGRAWLEFDDHLAVRTGLSERSLSDRDGLEVGDVQAISVTTDGVFIGGDLGVAHYDGHGFTTLRADRHPELSRVSGIVQSDNGDFWFSTISGVIRVTRPELLAAFAAPDHPFRQEKFDLDDGLPGVAQQDASRLTAIKSNDGKLWFVTSHGVAWIDPNHIMHNPLPPPVGVKGLIADGKAYPLAGAVDLPPGTDSLQIQYAALSLVVPERVQFRYKLDGVDADWVDPGSRREAFYTMLGPGHYLFHVIAANNSGVWNRTGATIAFTIEPTFLQSIWSKVLLVVVLLGTLYLLYALRLRHITQRLQVRLDERLSERERIARELHDTLLQSFQGLLFRFQAIVDELPAGFRARKSMEEALDIADEALAEGRDRITNLRSVYPKDDLGKTLLENARRRSTDFAGNLSVVVEGASVKLHPMVQEEATRLIDEAVANALHHAKAETIEVRIVYHSRELRIEVQDDGVGMASDIVAHGAGKGHFGLVGMRERAEKMRATFTISSREGVGTEVDLTIPASIAYAALIRPKLRFWRRHVDRMM